MSLIIGLDHVNLLIDAGDDALSRARAFSRTAGSEFGSFDAVLSARELASRNRKVEIKSEGGPPFPRVIRTESPVRTAVLLERNVLAQSSHL